jgi:hypothetical protein
MSLLKMRGLLIALVKQCRWNNHIAILLIELFAALMFRMFDSLQLSGVNCVVFNVLSNMVITLNMINQIKIAWGTLQCAPSYRRKDNDESKSADRTKREC